MHMRSIDEVAAEHGVIIGPSARMWAVFEFLRVIAGSESTVVITGESGTGKEVIASLIHRQSPRKHRPFVAVSCALFSDTLIESELFGHERGAFTGAIRDRPGRFEMAESGTVLLDDIDDVPLSMQVKLLRVLQNHTVERLGSTKTVSVNVRIIAGTKRDLRTMVADGTFREDLYYRLNVVPIAVPPLRERRDDIPALAMALLTRSCAENELDEREWTDDALEALMAHDWPGNVRELVHVVDRLAILTSERFIRGVDVRAALPGAPKLSGGEIPQEGKLFQLLEAFERRIIEDRITVFDGNMSKAADDLGLERSHLYKKVRRLGIAREG